MYSYEYNKSTLLVLLIIKATHLFDGNDKIFFNQNNTRNFAHLCLVVTVVSRKHTFTNKFIKNRKIYVPGKNCFTYILYLNKDNN